MKKRFSIFFAIIMIIVCVAMLASCDIFKGAQDPDDENIIFTITFDTQGGSSIASITIRDGETLILPQAPTKEGYVFDGWFLDANCLNKYNDTYVISSNITLYAKWKENDIQDETKYYVSFYVDGELYSQLLVKSGTLLTLPKEPTKTGYVFAGWYFDSAFLEKYNDDYVVLQDIILYAKWNPNHDQEDCDHIPVIDQGYNPTCVKEGLTDGSHCSLCGKILVKQTVIKELGHKEVVDQAVLPTCTETGLTEGKHCSVCQEVIEKQQIVDALGHIGGSPTCINQATCDRCHEKYGSLAGHIYGDLIPKVSSTCTETGIESHFKCAVCNKLFKNDSTLSEVSPEELCIAIDPTAHNFGMWKNDEGKDTHTRVCAFNVTHTETYTCEGGSATCTEKAICDICGSSYGEPLHHNYVNGVCTRCNEIRCSEGLSYSLNDDGSGYVLTGIGECTDKDIVIPSTYDSKPVISIDKDAFYGCSGLTSVIIPNSVMSIGIGAFNGCSSLESITIPFVGAKAGVTSSDKYQYPFGYIFGTSSYIGGVGTYQRYYEEITSYSTYYVPSSLKTVTVTGGNILYGAFYGCSGLTSITIPNSITSIGASAFYDCSGLTNITIPDTVTSIGSSTFSGCTGLTNIIIPGSVASIDSNAFYGCSGLTSITIPDNVTSIGELAFENCINLATVNWNATACTSAGRSYAPIFKGCSNLTTVNIGDNVTVIPSYAFDGCSVLATVNWNATACTSAGRSYSPIFKGCSNLTTVNIGDNVTILPDYIFDGCSKLTNITFPDSVISIGNEAFNNCSGITSIKIGNGITNIGSFAFQNCSGLINVTIPNSVTSIGDSAFTGCSSLESITIPFVGAKAGVTSNDMYQYPFGYIFGTSSYTGGVATPQFYHEGSLSYWTYRTYYIPSSLKSVTVTGGNILQGAFDNCSELTEVTIGSSVTSIGSFAFDECSSLICISVDLGNAKFCSSGNCLIDTTTKTLVLGCQTSVIPTDGSVTSIGASAFSGCRGLTNITIPDGVTSIGASAFISCEGLTSIAIPNSVTIVDDSAFRGCSGLTEMTLPNSVTSIGDYTFFDCIGLTSVNIGNRVTRIGNHAFENCSGLTSIVIPDSVTSIGSAAFYGCSGLASVYIADIEKWCAIIFAGMPSNPLYYARNLYLNNVLITDLTIPDGVTSIGYCSFAYLSSLTNVTISNSVMSIGAGAFYNCIGLTSITISDSVKDIGDSAFVGCSGLASIYYTGDVASWCGISGLDNLMSSSRTLYFDGNKVEGDLIIPDNMTSIGNSAFRGCVGLTSITIPDSVTSIGDYAFYGCTGLTNITISSGVTSIGDSAFAYCSGLTTVNWNATECTSTGSVGSNYNHLIFRGCSNLTMIYIGSNVTVIPSYAFYGCDGLTNITIPNSVMNIGSYAFAYCTGLVSITIPDSVTSIGSSAFFNCIGLTTVNWNATECASAGNSNHPIFEECSNLETVSIGDNVTIIPSYAFYCCYELINVNISNNVMSIGSCAFYGCMGLTDIIIPDSVLSIGASAFYGCSGLTNITIPDSVTSIGELAFENCINLTTVNWNATACTSAGSFNSPIFEGCYNLITVNIGDNVTTIPSYAFTVCYDLQKYEVSKNNAIYSSIDGILYNKEKTEFILIPKAIKGAVTIPNGVMCIDGYAFSGCRSLTSIIIPDSVTSIGFDAFYGCTSLTSVTIGKSVTSIDESAFNACDGLQKYEVSENNATYSSVDGILYNKEKTNIVDVPRAIKGSVMLPNSITSIDKNAFSGCSGLTSITIPNSVTSIGFCAFDGCSGLTSITIPDSVTSISRSAFSNCIGLTTVNWNATECTSTGNSSIFEDCSSLTMVYIGNNVTVIPSYAFAYCTGLTSITIPDRVASIGDSAFIGCTGLTSAAIGNGVTSINQIAFAFCIGLTNVTIPASVTSIGRYAFMGCYRLIEVYNKSSLNITAESEDNGCVAYYAKNVYTEEGGSKLSTDENGCVIYMDGDEKILVAYTGVETELFLPSYITKINQYAFYNCSSLTSIAIPDSVISIGNSAFSGCVGLTSITIPNSVTSIGESAFSDCSDLTTVLYAGTEEQWEAISINSNGNSSLTNAIRFYNHDGAKRTYSFVTNCDQSVDPITETYLSSLPTLTRDGYHFCGWYDNEGFEGKAVFAPYFSNDKTTLYAKWLTEEEWLASLDGTSFEKAYVAESGQTYDVTITTGGQIVYFAFTPTTSGSFTIKSTGSGNTYGTLYSSTQSSLKTNDNGGSGSNFRIIYTMTAGTTYYVAVKFYNSSTTGTFKVSFS